MNILIIDDILQTREGLQKFLSSYGYAVDIATNGKEATLRIQAKKYDIAFVDMILPDTDGASLMKKINVLSPFAHYKLNYILNSRESYLFNCSWKSNYFFK